MRAASASSVFPPWLAGCWQVSRSRLGGVRPDAHQPACHAGQRGAVSDPGEGHQAVLAQQRDDARLLGRVEDIGVVSAEGVHRCS
jgi:hypothetical protein